MKTERTYDYENDDLAPSRAIADIKEYMMSVYKDETQFNMMVAEVKKGISFETMAFYFGMCGVEGYPVRSFYAKYSPNSDAKEIIV